MVSPVGFKTCKNSAKATVHHEHRDVQYCDWKKPHPLIRWRLLPCLS
jgi:hypothetical protein